MSIGGVSGLERARAWVAIAGMACLMLVPATPSSAHARSSAQLERITAMLDRTVQTPGTAWVIEPTSDQVVVSVDDTVIGERLAHLRSATEPFGSAVRISHVSGTFRLLMAEGDAIWGSGSGRCSLGFNVVKAGRHYFLTAGHCGRVLTSWSSAQGGASFAVTQAATFPGHDYALVRYTGDSPHPSAVNLYNGGTRTITRAAAAYIGEAVLRSGSTTGVHGGRVTGLDATVNTPQGRVYGLIKTTVCAEQGDSGGPLFSGDAALGLTSVGESGDCARGGVSFYQPVLPALWAYGVSLG